MSLSGSTSTIHLSSQTSHLLQITVAFPHRLPDRVACPDRVGKLVWLEDLYQQIESTRMNTHEQPAGGSPLSKENVVIRLKQRLAEARAMGLRVRMEMLDGEQATWCEIAGAATLFVDLSQTAAEQLQQVEETLAAYAAQHSAGDAATSRESDADLTNRAA